MGILNWKGSLDNLFLRSFARHMFHAGASFGNLIVTLPTFEISVRPSFLHFLLWFADLRRDMYWGFLRNAFVKGSAER